MRLSFVCGNCGNTGQMGADIKADPDVSFVMAKAYYDNNGLLHTFVYCRGCRHVNVVTARGCLLSVLGWIFGMAPFAKKGVVPVQEFFTDYNTAEGSLPPDIVQVLQEDKVI